jgi:hypothetical protein
MDPQSITVEERIARLAGAAKGVVTRDELLTAAVSRDEIRGRVRKGALIVEHPGVYRVGPRTQEAIYMAAVKACGKGAVLSGLAAAHHLRLIKRPPSLPEVTAPTKREVKAVVTHRGRPRSTQHRGIPVTTPAQTLIHIAPRLGDEDLALACHEAGVKHKTTPRQVKAILKLRPNAPGAGKLKRIMIGDTKISLSALERKFLAILKEENLPLPITNRPEDGRYVDCRWPKHRLTVELDSYGFHNSRHSWEQDRHREREAYARGDQFRRYTYNDVFEDPTLMLAELHHLL